MNTPSAILQPAPPLRGAQPRARGAAAVQLVIPGRPQARLHNGDGRSNAAGRAYLDAVRTAAKRLQVDGQPLHQVEQLRVDVHLHYTSDHHAPPSKWPHESIPNADTAASLVLKALTGSLYAHASQANPLTITRTILKPHTAIATWGSAAARGCTVITWTAE